MKFGSLTMVVLTLAGCNIINPTGGKSPQQNGTNPDHPERVTLVPDAAGPAPALAEHFEVDSWESLLAHVAPGFTSEQMSYGDLAEKWKAVLDHESVDLFYLRFPYQGESSDLRATSAGQSCASTFFREGEQIDPRNFLYAPTMSEAVKTLIKDKVSLEKLEKVTVKDTSPEFAAVSYEYKRSYENKLSSKPYVEKTVEYTSHVGVAGSQFLEAYELIETEYMHDGVSLNLKKTMRCVRLAEPESQFERTSCSKIDEWGPRELFETQLSRHGSLLELTTKDGEHSVKEWKGSYDKDTGLSKTSLETAQTGALTAHFLQDYSKFYRGGVAKNDGYVNPHYNTAEGDLTFTFGKEDKLSKRDVSDCQVNTLNMQL